MPPTVLVVESLRNRNSQCVKSNGTDLVGNAKIHNEVSLVFEWK